MGIHQPEKCIWRPCFDLHLWSVALQTFLAIPISHSHDGHSWSSFTENPSTKYRNIAFSAKFSWPRYDLDLWPLTLKTFTAVATYMTNISAKCRWNASTKYGDITSGETVPDGHRTDELTNNQPTCSSPNIDDGGIKTEFIPDWFHGIIWLLNIFILLSCFSSVVCKQHNVFGLSGGSCCPLSLPPSVTCSSLCPLFLNTYSAGRDSF